MISLYPKKHTALWSSSVCLSNLVSGSGEHGGHLSLRGLNEALEDVLDRAGLRYYRVAPIIDDGVSNRLFWSVKLLRGF